MNISFFIARRYLFSKKSSNAINIITMVSMTGIMVGTAALIIVLSVFNGLSGLLEGLFAAFDPDIKIVAAEGRRFEADPDLYEKLANHPNIAVLTGTIEERVALQYYDKQVVAVIKGVEDNFTEANPIDSIDFVYDGIYSFEKKNGINQGVFGQGVAARLSINLNDHINPVEIKVLNDDAGSIANLAQAISFDAVFPSGVFSIQKEYDDKFILISLEFARKFFQYPNQLTAYEIALEDPGQVEAMKTQLQEMVGDKYEVLTWYQLHETLYRVMRNEKFIGYLILTLLLAIAAVNIVGSLSMIVLEKTRDIAVLKSLGATDKLIRRVFLTEGILVGGIGVTIGMLVAIGFGIAQERYGILTLQGGENFRINAFPIEMQFTDFAVIFITVISLSILASLYPSYQASKIGVIEGIRR